MSKHKKQLFKSIETFIQEKERIAVENKEILMSAKNSNTQLSQIKEYFSVILLHGSVGLSTYALSSDYITKLLKTNNQFDSENIKPIKENECNSKEIELTL